jgi:hypothetical protein
MITTGQIRVYTKYFGDEDMFVRCGSQEEKNLFPKYLGWGEIRTLIQDVYLLNSGKLSEPYAKKVREQLKSGVENEDVAKTITD